MTEQDTQSTSLSLHETRCDHPLSPISDLPAAEVLQLLPTLPDWPQLDRQRKAAKYRRGADRILTWLEQIPGSGWQERWESVNGDDKTWMETLASEDWRLEKTIRDELFTGLRFLMCIRAFRPGYDFFHGNHLAGFYDGVQRNLEPARFRGLDRIGHELGMSGKQINDGKKTLVRLTLHTGSALTAISEQDFFELRDHYLRRGAAIPHGSAQAWDLLAAQGVIKTSRPLTAVVRRQGQRPTADLVDAYRLRNRAVRDVLVRYLDHRRPSMDYATLRGLTTKLVKLFWADLEHHNPGIDSLHLSPDVAAAWKQRAQVITAADGSSRPRSDYLALLVSVRAFYLDIREWALEDAHWAPWAVPCPIRRGETDGMQKLRKKAIATAHQRVRDRLPHLDRIIDTAESFREETTALLALAENTQPDDCFEHHGIRYQHLQRFKTRKAGRHMGGYALPIKRLDTGEVRDIARDEDDAFWSWAIIETLHHTGIRLEELLEITHLALVQYQLPDTGELVPLLQIVPSKNAEERLLLVSPELANILAAVISRVRSQNNGTIPAIARYDPYERIEGPPLPHLFQRTSERSWRTTVISIYGVYGLLQGAVRRAGITDNTGKPLHYTPHDFRRMFATEAVTGGLPIHIAAKILGHAHLSTTQHYLAVFQDDMIRNYRAFLGRRRTVRPEAEYREPTDEEWREFHQHFHERKLELGTCGRPYGTPCQHEHACIRCPVLRVDPKQRGRLVEIIDSLNERIKEARMNGWLGEVQGLQTSLDAAAKKLVTLDRTISQSTRMAGPTTLPSPSFPH
jgi:integrase